eukprot:Hpha_TRINITY_DN24393_c0_g1::TRINITY_DN24393_c0_g1_i1::g.147990::m.147990
MLLVGVSAVVLAAVCPLRVNTSLRAPLQAREAVLLFSSYNDVLGPVITNLPYGDAGLAEFVRRANIGALRHPGGTIANWWNMSAGNFVQDCDSYCTYADQIRTNGLSDPFTPSSFLSTVTTQLWQERRGGGKAVVPVVFDLNLYKMSGDEMLAQIDLLAGVVPVDRPVFLSFGNEFYLSKYQDVFPNSTAYVAKFTPLSKKIRKTLPLARIGVVATPSGDWNTPIAAALRDDPSLFDYVVIHDYSAPFPDKRGEETLALWGAARVPVIAEGVRGQYGKDVPIVISEFNVNKACREALNARDMSYSVLHSVFEFNFRIAAACKTASVDVAMLHELAFQPGLAWGQGSCSLQLRANTSLEPPANFTFYSPMGQVSAHVAKALFGATAATATTCLSADHTCQSASSQSVVVKGMKCVHGVRNGDNSFVLTNGCDGEETDVTGNGIQVQLPFAAPIGHNSTVVQTVYFGAQGNGTLPVDGWWGRLSDCAEGPLHQCGPVVPQLRKHTVHAGDTTLQGVWLPPLSISILEL